MSATSKDLPDLYDAVRVQLELHPYRTVAIAAGLGYLLGTRLAGPIVALLSSRLGVQASALFSGMSEKVGPR
jgi:hypothetical protein